MELSPGDYAIVVRGNISGKVVQCLEIDTPPFKVKDRSTIWNIDRKVVWGREGKRVTEAEYIHENRLMKISPNPGQFDNEQE
jgi:hypothetical protein